MKKKLKPASGDKEPADIPQQTEPSQKNTYDGFYASSSMLRRFPWGGRAEEIQLKLKKVIEQL